MSFFRGLRTLSHEFDLCGRTFHITSVFDPAELLDQPDFAKPFLEQDKAPFGLELWPAAVMLAEKILSDEPGNDRLALDLGCGLGLTAMAAKARGWHITAGDHDEIALRFARYNAAVNHIDIDAYEAFDWHQPTGPCRFERILGADVLYQLTDQQPILRCIQQVLADDGVAILADPNRGVADCFAHLAHNSGVEVVVSQISYAFTSKKRRGRIFELRRLCL